MDKLNWYRQLIQKHLREIVGIVNRRPNPDVHMVCALDENHDQYLLLKVGWFQGHRVRAITLYVRILEARIWVEEDLTEDGIANALIRAGVPKEDIELGFLPPDQRQYAEFAVA